MVRVYASRFSPRLNAVLSKLAEEFGVGLEVDSLVEVKPVCWKIEADLVEGWGRLVAVLSRPASGIMLYFAGALKNSEMGIFEVEREDVEIAAASLGRLLAEPSKLRGLRDLFGFGLYASLLEGACKVVVEEGLTLTLIGWDDPRFMPVPPVRVSPKHGRRFDVKLGYELLEKLYEDFFLSLKSGDKEELRKCRIAILCTMIFWREVAGEGYLRKVMRMIWSNLRRNLSYYQNIDRVKELIRLLEDDLAEVALTPTGPIYGDEKKAYRGFSIKVPAAKLKEYGYRFDPPYLDEARKLSSLGDHRDIKYLRNLIRIAENLC